MKVIVAGTRTYTNRKHVFAVLDEFHLSRRTISEIVSGGAVGPDSLAIEWARWWDLPTRTFRAKWQDYGKAAGPIRNRRMAEYANALIAFWDEKSRGTRSMIKEARTRGLLVEVVQTTKEKRDD